MPTFLRTMMKVNNRFLLLLIPVITAIAGIAYISATSWQSNHFACDARLTIIESRGADDLIMHFRFDGHTGHVETKGRYTQTNGEMTETSNKVDFTFWREKGSLVLISNETNRIPKMPPPVLAHIPDFFSSRERGIRLQIVPKNASAYLFLYEGTPTLYCAITD